MGIDFFMKGTNADDGYADEAIESIIHPDDEYIYQSFIGTTKRSWNKLRLTSQDCHSYS